MKTLIIAFSILLSGYSNAQIIYDQHDLNFNQHSSCGWDWIQINDNAHIDPLQQGIKILYSKSLFKQDKNMRVVLNKQILVENDVYRPSEIRLEYRSFSNNPIKIEVVGFYSDERIAYQQSVSVNKSGKWSSVHVKCPNKDIKAYNIMIAYSGDQSKEQEFSLKNIKIDYHKEKGLTKTRSLDEASSVFQTNNAIPVDHWRSTPFKDVCGTDNIAVVALGECAHGSQTIANARIEFAKDLITNYNATWILLENSFDDVLLFDLYVQGILDDRDLIEDYLTNLTFASGGAYLKLLDWIREYNMLNNRKVHVMGIDNASPATSYALMDYYSSVFPKQLCDSVLFELFTKNISNVSKISQDTPEFIKKIGKDNYALLMHVLSKNIFPQSEEGFLTDRDYQMFIRTLDIHNDFVTNGELIVIMAHSKHIQKIPLFKKGHEEPTLGSLLSDGIKDKYYAIDFHFGNGRFVQDSCAYNSITIDSINNPPRNSFAYHGLQMPYEQFMYRTSDVPPKILTSLSINRHSLNRNSFEFTSLAKRYDVIFFSKTSDAFSDFDPKPVTSVISFNGRRQQKYQKINAKFHKHMLEKGTSHSNKTTTRIIF